jgi:transcriptional regulator with XRE-family HTH domain
MNDFILTQKTPTELNQMLAKRMVRIRKRRKISQKELSRKSCVSLGSLKRFEQTGEISLLSFSKLAIALGIDGELETLFEEVPFLSIEEVIHEQD